MPDVGGACLLNLADVSMFRSRLFTFLYTFGVYLVDYFYMPAIWFADEAFVLRTA